MVRLVEQRKRTLFDLLVSVPSSLDIATIREGEIVSPRGATSVIRSVHAQINDNTALDINHRVFIYLAKVQSVGNRSFSSLAFLQQAVLRDDPIASAILGFTIEGTPPTSNAMVAGNTRIDIDFTEFEEPNATIRNRLNTIQGWNWFVGSNETAIEISIFASVRWTDTYDNATGGKGDGFFMDEEDNFTNVH